MYWLTDCYSLDPADPPDTPVSHGMTTLSAVMTSWHPAAEIPGVISEKTTACITCISGLIIASIKSVVPLHKIFCKPAGSRHGKQSHNKKS